jgi:hypothetical protein
VSAAELLTGGLQVALQPALKLDQVQVLGDHVRTQWLAAAPIVTAAAAASTATRSRTPCQPPRYPWLVSLSRTCRASPRRAEQPQAVGDDQQGGAFVEQQPGGQRQPAGQRGGHQDRDAAAWPPIARTVAAIIAASRPLPAVAGV